MPNSGYFDVLFAAGGSRNTIPDLAPPNGAVSYAVGFGPNYLLQPGMPNALDVQNYEMNQALYDITAAIQQYQQNGIPPFITTAMNNGTPYSYTKGALVLNGGVVYQSLVAANTTTPPSAGNWQVFDLGLLALLASPAFSGNPTAPTQASNDSTTKLATTAFVNPASFQSAGGYMKLANGIIVQWLQLGGVTSAGQTFSLPIAFPNNFFKAVATHNAAKGTGAFSVSTNANGLNQIDATSNTGTSAGYNCIVIGN